MTRLLRISRSRLALGYVLLCMVMLALFAVPLWFAWRTNLSTFNAEVRGVDQQTLLEVFAPFWQGIVCVTAIVLVLGAAIGWLIRRGLLAEMHEITRTASAIVAGDQSRRIVTRGRWPELDALAEAVNGMLARLARQNAQLEGQIAVSKQAAENELRERKAELQRLMESVSDYL